MSISSSLIGKGPAFPFNRSFLGGLEYRGEIDRINQSLFILFETPKGSRLMMPEFGSDLYKYRFDPLDKILMDKIKHTITSDVKRWEPRISNLSIEFLSDNNDIDNNILYVSITYTIINTAVVGNYVYPYKLNSYDTLDANYN